MDQAFGFIATFLSSTTQSHKDFSKSVLIFTFTQYQLLQFMLTPAMNVCFSESSPTLHVTCGIVFASLVDEKWFLTDILVCMYSHVYWTF